MALTKEAVLSLRLEGFRDAERAGRAIAAALALAESFTARLASTGTGAQKSLADVATAADRVQAAADHAGVALQKTGERGKVAGNAVRSALEQAGQRGVSAFQELQATGEGAASSLRAAFSGVGLAIVGVGAAISFGIVEQAARMGDVSASFNRLATAAGGAEAVLTRLRRASGGAIDDMTLMQGANRLLMGDLDVSAERMGRLAAAAVRLGRAAGVSAKEAFEDLARGVQTGHTRILEEIGLTVNAEDALRRYALANGIASDMIDERTRRLVNLQAIEEAVAQVNAKLGSSGDAAATPAQRLSAVWANFVMRLDDMLGKNPAIVSALEALSSAAMKLIEAFVPIIDVGAKVIAKLGELKLLTPLISAFLAGKAATSVGSALGLEGSWINTAIGAGAALTAGVASYATQSDGPAESGSRGRRDRGSTTADGGGISVHVDVPLHDETIDRTANRVGEIVALGMRRRIDDVTGGLASGLARGLESQFANSFEP